MKYIFYINILQFCSNVVHSIKISAANIPRIFFFIQIIYQNIQQVIFAFFEPQSVWH